MGVIDGKTDREMDWKHYSLSNVTIAELLIVTYEYVEDTVRERDGESEKKKRRLIDRFVDRFKSAYQSVLMISIPKSTSLMIPPPSNFHPSLPLATPQHQQPNKKEKFLLHARRIPQRRTTTTTNTPSNPRRNLPLFNPHTRKSPILSNPTPLALRTTSLGQSQNSQMPIFPIRVRLSGNRIHDQFQIFSSHGMVKGDGARVEIYTVGDVMPYSREERGVPVRGCAGG